MPPTLGLELSHFAKHRSRLALALIEGPMIWPNEDDEAQRRLTYQTAWTAHLGDHLSRMPTKERRESFCELNFAEAFSRERENLPLRLHQEQVYPRVLDGLLAGYVLCDLVASSEVGWKGPIVQASKESVSFLRCDNNGKPLSMGTMNTLWPKFQPSAHLWAAFVCNTVRCGHATFPCALRDLEFFLGLAEFFRIKGETLKLKNRGERALNEKHTWRLAHGLPVQPVPVVFEDRGLIKRNVVGVKAGKQEYNRYWLHFPEMDS